jgi:hypothetical protein
MYGLRFPGIGGSIGPIDMLTSGRTMPYDFEFDSANRILRCRLSGLVTDEVLQEFFQAGSQHARRTHPTAGVVDFSEVTALEVSAETIRQIAKSLPAFSDPGLQRVIVAPTPHLYGMMRMFATQGEEIRPNLHVVHSEKEAWAILAVQDPHFKPLENN